MIETSTATRDPEDVALDPRAEPLADRPVGHAITGAEVRMTRHPSFKDLPLPGSNRGSSHRALLALAVTSRQLTGPGRAGFGGSPSTGPQSGVARLSRLSTTYLEEP
jgi:hypothetical protein